MVDGGMYMYGRQWNILNLEESNIIKMGEFIFEMQE